MLCYLSGIGERRLQRIAAEQSFTENSQLMSKKRFAALPCAVLLAACAVTDGTPAGKAPELAGRSLMWAEGANEDCEVPPNIEFRADGSISGLAGCNRMVGSWALDGKKIDLSKLGATRRMCGPKIMAVEDAFFGKLGQTIYMTADGDKVLCWDKDGKLVMTLVPEAAGSCN